MVEQVLLAVVAGSPGTLDDAIEGLGPRRPAVIRQRIREMPRMVPENPFAARAVSELSGRLEAESGHASATGRQKTSLLLRIPLDAETGARSCRKEPEVVRRRALIDSLDSALG